VDTLPAFFGGGKRGAPGGGWEGPALRRDKLRAAGGGRGADGKVPPFGGINSGLPEVAEGSERVKEAESLHNRPVM